MLWNDGAAVQNRQEPFLAASGSIQKAAQCPSLPPTTCQALSGLETSHGWLPLAGGSFQGGRCRLLTLWWGQTRAERRPWLGWAWPAASHACQSRSLSPPHWVVAPFPPAGEEEHLPGEAEAPAQPLLGRDGHTQAPHPCGNPAGDSGLSLGKSCILPIAETTQRKNSGNCAGRERGKLGTVSALQLLDPVEKGHFPTHFLHW